MRLTRQEILLLAALLAALVLGEFVQKFRATHPVNLATPKPVRKNNSSARIGANENIDRQQTLMFT